MADRERLLELLNVNTCPNQICNFCEHFRNTSACERYKMERIADHLIQNGVIIQKWIPVTELLPEKEALYFVAVKNDHERRYSKTAWYHGHGNWFLRQIVTHWMPLPEPPKEVV